MKPHNGTVTAGRDLQRADESKVRDRLVEFWIENGAQRNANVFFGDPAGRPGRARFRVDGSHRTPARSARSGWRGPVAVSSAFGSWSSAGTGMLYILAALSPRIFF